MNNKKLQSSPEVRKSIFFTLSGVVGVFAMQQGSLQASAIKEICCVHYAK